MTMIAKRRAVYQWRLDVESDASSSSYDYDDGQTASRVPAEKTNEAKQEEARITQEHAYHSQVQEYRNVANSRINTTLPRSMRTPGSKMK